MPVRVTLMTQMSLLLADMGDTKLSWLPVTRTQFPV